MTVYAWPAAWKVKGFSLTFKPNTRSYVNTYTQQADTIDLLGGVWRARVDMPSTGSLLEAGEREGFFDRLCGTSHQIELWNLRRPRPLGTLRGTPVLASAAAQLSNVLVIAAPNNTTLLAGDMIGVGGQLLRVMASAVAAGGVMTVEVLGRLRVAQPAGTAVLWDKPRWRAMLTSADGVPIDHAVNGTADLSFELIERS